MTMKEAASVLGVSVPYMHRLIVAGKVKAKRHGIMWNVNKTSLNAFKRKREESMANA